MLNIINYFRKKKKKDSMYPTNLGLFFLKCFAILQIVTIVFKRVYTLNYKVDLLYYKCTI